LQCEYARQAESGVWQQYVMGAHSWSRFVSIFVTPPPPPPPPPPLMHALHAEHSGFPASCGPSQIPAGHCGHCGHCAHDDSARPRSRGGASAEAGGIAPGDVVMIDVAASLT
jgi:hypothetical protein